MPRKAFLTCALVLLASALLAAPAAGVAPQVAAQGTYTMVLKNGQRIEARSRYVLARGRVKFVGLDGTPYEFPLSQVNLLATNNANRTPGKPKRKVWTNYDLEQLSDRAPISVMGGRRSAAPAGEAEGEAAAEGEAGEPAPDPETTKDYWQERLKPLRDELAQIEQQLRQFRSGRGQAASNVIDVNTNAAGVDPTDTAQRLERRRREIQQQMAAIRAEARRKGIPPGYVR